MKRIATALALAAAITAAATAPARAWTFVDAAGTPVTAYQSWADGIRMPTPRLAVTLVLHDEDGFCEGRDGCASQQSPTTIWMPAPTRQTLVHELGHIFDYARMDDQARDEFRRIIRDSRPWRSAPNSPHEKFAEAYRMCASKTPARLYDSKGRAFYEGNYDLRLSPRQRLAACRLIRSR